MEEKQITKRNYLFDNLRVILIFLVVLGHFIELIMANNTMLLSMHAIIYSFHMPLFVFISGYFSKSNNNTFKNSVFKILIPYILFNGIYAIINGNFSIESFLTPQFAFWYLLSLFFWKITSKYLIKIKFIFPITIVFAMVVGFIPEINRFLSLSRTIVFLPFFILGLKLNEDAINKIRSRPKLIFIILSAVSIITVAILSFFKIIPNEIYRQAQSYSDTDITNLNGVVFRFYSIIVAFILIISIINFITEKKLKFTYIGERTMTIFVFHSYIILILKKYGHQIIMFAKDSHFALIMCLIATLIIVLLFSTKPFQRLYNTITFSNLIIKIKTNLNNM